MRYSSDHAWADLNGDGTITVGITTFAVGELGEISFIELPRLGTHVSAGDSVCSLDSLKSTSDIYSPVSGEVVKINDSLSRDDGLTVLNSDPMGEGWVFVLKPVSDDEYGNLIDEQAYEKLTGS